MEEKRKRLAAGSRVNLQKRFSLPYKDVDFAIISLRKPTEDDSGKRANSNIKKYDKAPRRGFNALARQSAEYTDFTAVARQPKNSKSIDQHDLFIGGCSRETADTETL